MPRPSGVGNNLLRHCRQHPRKLLGLLCVLLLGVGFGLWSLPDKVENHGTGDFDIGLTQLLGDLGILTVVGSLRDRALAIWASTRGPEHPLSLARMRGEADWMMDRGDWAGAVTVYRHELAVRERTLGSEHPDTLDTLANLAAILCQAGAREKAVSLARRIMKVRERTLGQEHPDTLQSRCQLVQLLRLAGALEEAESLGERLVQGFTATRGTNDYRTQHAQEVLDLIRRERAAKTPGK